ncbi:MAG: L-threonylcarbamoyladenylate synthase [Pseudomonadota bacterium]
MEIIKANNIDKNDNLSKVVSALQIGEVICYPTETIYGLGADAFNFEANLKIFALKERQTKKPLLILISKLEMLSLLINDMPLRAKKIVEEFWPGPLTIIFDIHESINHGLSKLISLDHGIAIRFTSNPCLLKIIEAFGGPITSTSANPSSLPNKVNRDDIIKNYSGKIKYFIDDGELNDLRPSTIIDVRNDSLKLLRDGRISFNKIKEVL